MTILFSKHETDQLNFLFENALIAIFESDLEIYFKFNHNREEELSGTTALFNKCNNLCKELQSQSAIVYSGLNYVRHVSFNAAFNDEFVSTYPPREGFGNYPGFSLRLNYTNYTLPEISSQKKAEKLLCTIREFCLLLQAKEIITEEKKEDFISKAIHQLPILFENEFYYFSVLQVLGSAIRQGILTSHIFSIIFDYAFNNSFINRAKETPQVINAAVSNRALSLPKEFYVGKNGLFSKTATQNTANPDKAQNQATYRKLE